MIRNSPIVRVVAYRKSADSAIQLRVTPDVLDMTEYAKGDHLITWRLDTKGFRFSTETKEPAIEFTSPGSKETFSDLKVHCHGRFATVHNKNTDGLAFAYNVHVVEAATGVKAFLDPVVQNNDY